MRRVVLGLVTAFALLQLVSYTACACDGLCGHKNACERGEAAGDDCCDRRAPHSSTLPKEEAPCFHLEPQSDVDIRVAAFDVPIVAVLLEDLPALPSVILEAPRVRPIGLSPPFQELPLYLAHLALLI